MYGIKSIKDLDETKSSKSRDCQGLFKLKNGNPACVDKSLNCSVMKDYYKFKNGAKRLVNEAYFLSSLVIKT